MSWNTFHISLTPGATIEWWYGWGDDHGAQIAQPREFTGSTRNNKLKINYDGLFRDTNNAIWYFVSVTNNGPNTATFELVGGGLT